MPEDVRRQVLLEYDTSRVVSRWMLGLLMGLLFELSAHGYIGWTSGDLACSGGWPEAIEFLVAIVSAMGFIEFVHWAIWRIRHRNEIGLFHEREILAGRDGPFSRETSLDQSGTAAAARDYDLVLSGGQILLGSLGQVGNLCFGLILFMIYLSIGTPSPCERLNFDWRSTAGTFIFAYSILMFGSIAQNQLKRNA
jgi:hypothetical protein